MIRSYNPKTGRHSVQRINWRQDGGHHKPKEIILETLMPNISWLNDDSQRWKEIKLAIARDFHMKRNRNDKKPLEIPTDIVLPKETRQLGERVRRKKLYEPVKRTEVFSERASSKQEEGIRQQEGDLPIDSKTFAGKEISNYSKQDCLDKIIQTKQQYQKTELRSPVSGAVSEQMHTNEDKKQQSLKRKRDQPIHTKASFEIASQTISEQHHFEIEEELQQRNLKRPRSLNFKATIGTKSDTLSQSANSPRSNDLRSSFSKVSNQNKYSIDGSDSLQSTVKISCQNTGRVSPEGTTTEKMRIEQKQRSYIECHRINSDNKYGTTNNEDEMIRILKESSVRTTSLEISVNTIGSSNESGPSTRTFRKLHKKWGYSGVTLRVAPSDPSNPWEARCGRPQVVSGLGSAVIGRFKSREEAARAVDAALRQYGGVKDLQFLNFPTPEELRLMKSNTPNHCEGARQSIETLRQNLVKYEKVGKMRYCKSETERDVTKGRDEILRTDVGTDGIVQLNDIAKGKTQNKNRKHNKILTSVETTSIAGVDSSRKKTQRENSKQKENKILNSPLITSVGTVVTGLSRKQNRIENIKPTEKIVSSTKEKKNKTVSSAGTAIIGTPRKGSPLSTQNDKQVTSAATSNIGSIAGPSREHAQKGNAVQIEKKPHSISGTAIVGATEDDSSQEQNQIGNSRQKDTRSMSATNASIEEGSARKQTQNKASRPENKPLPSTRSTSSAVSQADSYRKSTTAKPGKSISTVTAGDRIAFEFSNGVYFGEIKECDTNHGCRSKWRWQVLFDDGEVYEFDVNDMRKSIALHKRILEKEVNNWKYNVGNLCVGDRIAYMFGNGVHFGAIKACKASDKPEKKRAWTVLFDDGDVEEFDYKKMKKSMAVCNEIRATEQTFTNESNKDLNQNSHCRDSHGEEKNTVNDSKREEKLKKLKKDFMAQKEKIERQLPERVKKRFFKVGFAQWEQRYLPVLFLGPYDISPGAIRKQWLRTFNNRAIEDDIPQIVFWFGSDVDDGFSILPEAYCLSFKAAKTKGLVAMKGGNGSLARDYNKSLANLFAALKKPIGPGRLPFKKLKEKHER
ncbi:unnamed protein product [Pseudo-nitzschia multistriata]|uniref:AP2/ERF domain-containing protein n=1 Tax=Pseudo-nitzschia multistriata TaxID=183589 RepID=A0A448Z1E1_9STRA|nr:unnamed protein product [Pseudo-nitzschia multistriata]